MPSHYTRYAKKARTHTSNQRALNEKNDAHRLKQRGKQKVKTNKKKQMTRSQNIDNYACTYYAELFEQQINPNE